MNQYTLFSEANVLASGDGNVVAIVRSTKALSKTQRRFNQLIARLNEQRQELTRWKAFKHEYHERVAGDYQPLAARLREKRIAMARLFDRSLDGTGLGSRQREKVFDIFSQLVQDLLGEARDEELVRLYDKYADVTFAEEQQNALQTMSALAQEEFGIDTHDYSGEAEPEDLAAWIGEQVRGSTSRRTPGSSSGKRSASDGKSAAVAARAAERGTQALREIFRRLVSELHPDREIDVAERMRKTDLMKEVNVAYAAGDLLRLLEIQLDIEQIKTEDISHLAAEKLDRYITVFEEQSRQLRDEIAELIEPILLGCGRRTATKVTPELLRRDLATDIHSLKQQLRDVESDLLRFQDIRQLKESLRLYRIEPTDDDDWIPGPRRPRRRGGRNAAERM